MKSRPQALLLGVCCLFVLAAGCVPAAASLDSASAATSAITPASATPVNCPGDSALPGVCPTATYPAPTLSVEQPLLPSATQPALTFTPVPETPATSAASTILPTPTPCPPGLCSSAAQYFLQRPISPDQNDQVDVTYRFGTTQGGRREPHHGVEFLNAHGTPVLAAGEGLVIVAGQDIDPISPPGSWPPVFYGMFSSFYGNLVVIEHQPPPGLLQVFPLLPSPIYTVYAHLSEISVQVGQQVQTGEEVGKVGMTGVAEGSHLHFEVRLGENLYDNARNPELWLAPHMNASGQLNGGLAGTIVDGQGNVLVLENSIVLEHLPTGPDSANDLEFYVQDYEGKELLSQLPFEEIFALGDIPPGWYRISFPHNGLQKFLVEVFPGQLTWVRIQVP